MPGFTVRLAGRTRPASSPGWRATCRDEDRDEATGEIYAIYVTPAYWGAGIGRQLMSAGVSALRREGFRRVSLWVLEGNVRARGFYEAAGLSPDGGRKLLDMAGEAPEIRYAGPL